MILHDIFLFWQSNVFVTFVPPNMVFISQALQLWQEVGPVILLQRFVRCFLYTFLGMYQFNVIDQIVGIEEDKINKPNRPLVTGAITVCQAWFHYVVSLTLYILYGYTEGLTGETLLWVGISVILKLTEYGKSGIWKNLLAAPVAYVLYGVPYGYAYDITNLYDRNFHVWRTIVFFCVVLSFVIPAQDLRDVVGDRKSGMKTLPVLYGLRAGLPNRNFENQGFSNENQ